MFSLVIVIIAIALVSVLALATLYYGADTFTSSQEKSNATRLINEGTQVKAAAALYLTNEHKKPTTLDELVEGQYLRSNVLASGWGSQQGNAQVADVSASQCELINKLLNIPGVPSCDDPRYTQRPVCCNPAQQSE